MKVGIYSLLILFFLFPLNGLFSLEKSNVLIEIFGRLNSNRVDFVAIGDSNQLHSNNGWDGGMIVALSENWPMYATGFISSNENNSNGSGIGLGFKFHGSQSKFGDSFGAPSSLHKYWDKGLGNAFPHNYIYMREGIYNGNSGMILFKNGPITLSEKLKFQYHYGTFNYGEGSFRIILREDVAPYNRYLTSPKISTYSTEPKLEKIEFILEEDEVRLNKNLGFTYRYIKGPFFGLWMRVFSENIKTGFSFHTLNARGGKSARVLAEDLNELNDNSLSYYFSQIRENQGATKTIVIVINSGLNDINETEASLGPLKISDGSSADAFSDNHLAIINKIKEIWEINSWPSNELYWLLIPSHPVSISDTELLDYRNKLEELSENIENCEVINLEKLYNHEEMLAKNYYASEIDFNHLSEEGYNGISKEIFDEENYFKIQFFDSSTNLLETNYYHKFDSEDLISTLIMQDKEILFSSHIDMQSLQYPNGNLYSLQQIQNLSPGSTMIEVTGSQATVQLQMEESSDLETWTEAGTPATMTIPADTDTKFFRFKMAE